MSRLADALTARISTTKRRLIAGGVQQPVEWLRRTGPRDVRGRQTLTNTPLDAFIEQRPALDRGTFTTDQADDTVLTILEPLALTDSDTFRWGEHTYRISKVDGIVKDEVTGTRFFSEVFVLRSRPPLTSSEIQK